MAETPYNHYALYEPDASPDLTATGEYNSAIMGIDSDMHSERMEREQEDANLHTAIDNETETRKAEDTKLAEGIATETAERKADTQAAREERTRIEREYKAADARMDERITTLNNQEIADVRDVNAKLEQEVTDRKAADTALDTKFTGGLNNVTQGLSTVGNGLTAEQKARADADTALGKRIDNAEAEISANSADLTGIKGLTYGSEHVQFLEHDNGSYSSPALEEIHHEISDLQSQGAGTEWYTITIEAYSGTLTSDALAKLKSHWPHVMVSICGINLLYPMTFIGHEYVFQSNIPDSRGSAYADGISVNGRTGEYGESKTYYAPNWDKVSRKPFSTIGTGLKVVSDAITVDADTLPSDFTVVITSGNKLTNAQFNAINANWPKVALNSGNSLLFPAAKSSDAYIFSATFFADIGTADNTVTLKTPTVVAITVDMDKSMSLTSFKVAELGAITPDAQWGTIEA